MIYLESRLRNVTLLWAFATPRTILVDGSDRESVHPVGSCETNRLFFQSFGIGVEMQKLWEVKVKILFRFKNVIR